jgi:hypothetical protein
MGERTQLREKSVVTCGNPPQVQGQHPDESPHASATKPYSCGTLTPHLQRKRSCSTEAGIFLCGNVW